MMENKIILPGRLHEEDINIDEMLQAGFDYLGNLPVSPLATEAEIKWLNAELEKLNLSDLQSE